MNEPVGVYRVDGSAEILVYYRGEREPLRRVCWYFGRFDNRAIRAAWPTGENVARY
jgi:hypothetical protein